MPRAARGIPARGVPVRAIPTLALAALVLSACGEDASGPRPGAATPRVGPADVVAVRATVGGEEATGTRVDGAVLTVAHALPAGARPGGATVARVGSPARPARLLARDDGADLAVVATPGATARDDAARHDVGREGADPDDAAPGGDEETGGPAGAAPHDGAGWRVLLRREGLVVARPAGLRRRISALVDAPGSGTGGRRPALELAVRAAPGDSGAPVVDAGGRLVGVLFAVSQGRRATAYAVTAGPAVALLRAAGRR